MTKRTGLTERNEVKGLDLEKELLVEEDLVVKEYQGLKKAPGGKRAPGMDTERLSRAALSRLMEPQDAAGLALVQVAGATDALRIATGEVPPGPELEREITSLLVDSGAAAS